VLAALGDDEVFLGHACYLSHDPRLLPWASSTRSAHCQIAAVWRVAGFSRSR
jgi:hypothetical protein